MALQIYRPDIVVSLPEYAPARSLAETSRPARVAPVEEDESERRGSGGQSGHGSRHSVDSYASVLESAETRRPALVAGDIMTAAPRTLRADARVARARLLFRRLGFGHLPLVNADGRIVGLLSDHDLLQRDAAEGPAPDRVEEVAVQEVLTATVDTAIRDVADVMLQRRLGCVPIVDPQGRPVGIVTRADILRALVQRAPLELWV